VTATSELADLYQEVVLDHGKRPRNFGPLEGATHRAEGLNPLCGDRITVHARVEDDVVREARFEGNGCAISKASASVMTGVVKGKTGAEIDALFERFHRLVTEGPREGDGDLGKLAVFGGAILDLAREPDARAFQRADLPFPPAVDVVAEVPGVAEAG
jgi:nitrogen fixation NifU-like protein